MSSLANTPTVSSNASTVCVCLCVCVCVCGVSMYGREKETAQRTELVESIFGLRPSTGSIYIHNKKVDINNPIDAKNAKIALLTEDRRTSGIVGCLGVDINIMLASYKQFAKFGTVLDDRFNRDLSSEYVKKLNVKTAELGTKIATLSGGNQQKALIARWLLTEPDILILDEPTRGIDVGAKYEVYQLMHELAAAGTLYWVQKL